MDKWWKELLKYVLEKGKKLIIIFWKINPIWQNFAYFSGCYKGVDFDLPQESNESGILDLDTNVQYELDDIEKKIQDMNMTKIFESTDSEEDGGPTVDFEAFQLNDISQQEYQQGLAWKNDM